MKKIINHKLYNTETAKFLGEDWNGVPTSDFSYCSECLYKTRKGNYFLYGEGGPMSKYSVSCGMNEWSGSEVIKPLTEEDARVWAEEHLSTDEFIETFGQIEEA